MRSLCGPFPSVGDRRTAGLVAYSVGKGFRRHNPKRRECIRHRWDELDLDRRSLLSSVRNGGKVFGRCMESYCQCIGDMPTEHDFPPVYGPLCGVMRGM